MVSNENLNSVVIRFYRPARSGVEEQYYTVTLTNARIVGIMPIHSSADAQSAKVPMRESISLTFDTITFEYMSDDGAIIAQDSWQVPAQ